MLLIKKHTKIIIIIFMLLFFLGIISYFKENSHVKVINSIIDDRKYVYPMGNIVGISAETDGALVIGYEEDDINYIGGLKVGDNIFKINDEEIKNSNDISKILNELCLEKVKVTFERNNQVKDDTINVKYENGKYKLGLWVRDKVTGIGTMTFYDPSEKTFFAIGHAITDVDTNILLKIKEGYLYNIDNLKIIKGNTDKVGKIKGNLDLSKSIGEFKNNSNFGICGNLINELSLNNKLIELGTPEDVKIDKAIILFEDENRNIKSYDINIEKIINDKTSDRHMVIKVIDKDLINFTGGIVQGMSGIPIIQNNKLIGSITHVFKNNPKKGYGIFIDEMIQ